LCHSRLSVPAITIDCRLVFDKGIRATTEASKVQ